LFLKIDTIELGRVDYKLIVLIFLRSTGYYICDEIEGVLQLLSHIM